MTSPRPISIAIAAMGGQGGGVLSGWLVDIAEHAGYLAQSTSVPGVAQRTGATIYYVEIFPKSEVKEGHAPVFALMPTPGDVDVALAAEFIEAGRAIMRGIVTPDRTTLIASTHREYAVSEKSAMGDARADGEAVMQAARESARRLIDFDMARIADGTGSMISSVLLGALAASDSLPFERTDFEAAILRGGFAVDANLAGFAAGYAKATGEGEAGDDVIADGPEPVTSAGQKAQELLTRINQTFPPEVRETVIEGARRCADFQDFEYSGEYVDRVADMFAGDKLAEGAACEYDLTAAFARHLALWMTYEDVIRVASLKTRGSRFARLRDEVGVEADQVVAVAEFMHPRFEEICDTMPAGLGAWMQHSRLVERLLAPFLRRGRRIRTSTVSGYLMLRFLARLRRFRRGTLRFRREMAAIEDWTREVTGALEKDYALAVEIVGCQRLIKGYGETHARGSNNYAAIVAQLPRIAERGDAAERVRALRDAALADDEGRTLAQVLLEMGAEY